MPSNRCHEGYDGPIVWYCQSYVVQRLEVASKGMVEDALDLVDGLSSQYE